MVEIDREVREWTIREQVIEDAVSGLMFQFEVIADDESPFRLRAVSPDRNCEIAFDGDGEFAGFDPLVGPVSEAEPLEQMGWRIQEQIVEDLASGLTFQFEAVPESELPFRFRVFGNLPYGNREILFDPAGQFAATGTALSGHWKPTWLFTRAAA